jgi:2-oxoglutarate ferredoxin oxidoreductase subunit alpha
VRAAAEAIRAAGHDVARAHIRHLNPFPANLGDVLRAYDRVLVPEMNLGQLTTMLRARYLVDVASYSRVRGLPINSAELAADVIKMIQELSA